MDQSPPLDEIAEQDVQKTKFDATAETAEDWKTEMKTTQQPLTLFTLALLLTLGAFAPSLEAQTQTAAAGEELYYAIEVDGNLCGYSHLTTSPLPGEGRDELLLEHQTVVRASLLGAAVDSETELTYHLGGALLDRFGGVDLEVLHHHAPRRPSDTHRPAPPRIRWSRSCDPVQSRRDVGAPSARKKVEGSRSCRYRAAPLRAAS